MNSHQPILPQAQPAIPLNGRPGHNAPYAPSPHPPQQPPYYQGYQYQYPVHYQRPPQQWTPYPMPMSMGRGYQPYPPMTPYQIPPHLPPMRPSPQHAPSSSSVRSVQGMLSPSSSNTSLHVPSSTPITVSNPYRAPPTPPPPPPPSVPPPSQRTPFYPPLPWQSFEGAFPPRVIRRRRKTPAPQSSSVPVELPRRGSIGDIETVPEEAMLPAEAPPGEEPSRDIPALETPLTSQPPSEALSTQPTTPSSEITPKMNAASRPSVPLLPIVPAVPNLPLPSRPSKRASISAASDVINGAPPNADHLANAVETAAKVDAEHSEDIAKSVETINSPPIKAAPKSWADLVRTTGQNSTARTIQAPSDTATKTNGFTAAKAGSLADALSSYSVKENDDNAKIAFLEPRGLVNTGNMCYMNSVGPICSSVFSDGSDHIARFCRSLYFVYHSTIFSRTSEDKRHIASKAILRSWMPCKPIMKPYLCAEQH